MSKKALSTYEREMKNPEFRNKSSLDTLIPIQANHNSMLVLSLVQKYCTMQSTFV